MFLFSVNSVQRELREFALELFPSAEQASSDISPPDIDTVMSVRASTTPSDRKLSELFDSQNRLVESMQQLVKQQTEMNTKMQEVSEGVLRKRACLMLNQEKIVRPTTNFSFSKSPRPRRVRRPDSPAAGVDFPANLVRSARDRQPPTTGDDVNC